MELLVIGDVGGPDTYHVGDEAMLEANLAELSRRHPDARFTVVSADPDAVAARYGVDASRPVGFARGDDADAAHRDRLLVDLAREADEVVSRGAAPRHHIVEAVGRADAVLVSGGGNLNSTWPGHLYERVALLTLARRFGKGALVVGQTIGPELEPRERELLREVLGGADLVGVRETRSARYARVLGVREERLSLQLDDAFFLEPSVPGGDLAETGAPLPRIVVTLTRGVEPMEAVAEQLGRLARDVEARLTFVPHARAPDDDRAVGRELAAALGPETELELLEVEDARTSRRRIEGAAMVISSRYHPVVFAVAAGVPSIGIHLDEYTRVKLTGALQHAGLENWTLPWVVAREGALLEGARQLWQRREAVTRQIDLCRERWRAMHRRHWRRIDRVLAGAEPGESPEPASADPLSDPEARPGGSWGRMARALREESDRIAQEKLNLIAERDEAVRYAVSLRTVLEARDEENAALREELKGGGEPGSEGSETDR